jgi:hypothetical protein
MFRHARALHVDRVLQVRLVITRDEKKVEIVWNCRQIFWDDPSRNRERDVTVAGRRSNRTPRCSRAARTTYNARGDQCGVEIFGNEVLTVAK